MIDVLYLALPYFGLILLGFACGRFKTIPYKGLAWMDFFVVYLSLRALFYRILARTPFEQLNNVRFILAVTLGTFLVLVLVLSFCVALEIRRNLAESAIAALAGAYVNIGYMGPGLARATVGAQAGAPVALIFCFETLLFFTLLPAMMALARPTYRGAARVIFEVARKILLHPFVVATALGGAPYRGARRDRPAAAVSPERIRSLCAVHARRDGGAASVHAGAVEGAAADFDQARGSSSACADPDDGVRAVRPGLGKDGGADGGAAPALNVFVLARQYDAWVEPASGSVLIDTLVSVATLTTVMWLVQHGVLTQLMFR